MNHMGWDEDEAAAAYEAGTRAAEDGPAAEASAAEAAAAEAAAVATWRKQWAETSCMHLNENAGFPPAFRC